MSFTTPLKNARGLGAVKSGVSHWLTQRVAALALIPLTLWSVFAIAALNRADYTTVLRWFADPLHTILLILFVIAALYHAILGMRVILQDYIKSHALFLIGRLICKFLLILIGVLSVVSLLRIFFLALH